MKRGAKHARQKKNNSKIVNHPERHSGPIARSLKTRQKDRDWRLRKVLRALAAGARLILKHGGKAWHCVKADGGKLKVKVKLLQEMITLGFVNGLRITNWGRLATGWMA